MSSSQVRRCGPPSLLSFLHGRNHRNHPCQSFSPPPPPRVVIGIRTDPHIFAGSGLASRACRSRPPNFSGSVLIANDKGDKVYFSPKISLVYTQKILKIMTPITLMRKIKHCELALTKSNTKISDFPTCSKLRVGSKSF